MDWTVEALSILLTGVLFFGIVFAGLTSYVTLSMMSFVSFSTGAVVFIGAAFALARVQAVNYPPLLWALPLLPLLIIGVLVKDAVAARRESSQPAHATAIARPDDERLFAAPSGVPAELVTESGGGGEESARLRAASAHVSPNELAHMAINHPELRPIIAVNPLTPVSVLEWLVQRGSPEATSALAARTAGASGASVGNASASNASASGTATGAGIAVSTSVRGQTSAVA
jgi:hypothetical protein